MMEYRYLRNRGALNEASQETASGVARQQMLAGLVIQPAAVALVPETVARENLVMPLSFDGETLTLAAVNPGEVMLADKLGFILNKNIRFLGAPRQAIVDALNRIYGQSKTESVTSMLAEFTDTAIDDTDSEEAELEAPEVSADLKAKPRGWLWWTDPGRYLGKGIMDLKKGLKGLDDKDSPGLDLTENKGGSGVFYYVVDEGQRVLMRRPDGTMTVIVGPKRVWKGGNRFTPMAHYVAHPGEFLIVRYRDGRQEHLAGPADVWLDPRVHQTITQQDGLQIGTKEAVVVYSRASSTGVINQRIVYGPNLFIPQPGEWLHTFSWHSSRGGHKGAVKEPNALVFQKLWLMPDQMYHDVADVRTADDAVLTVRLMIFFELTDIERMLDTTHDPIGDFVNAATSDVVGCVGQHDFESFKHNTGTLNDLETYRQLTGRAGQCGYRINKVVYRGYGAPDSLQQMHDQAIEARTRLQLQRATEQQAQDLENYKLDCQITRATKRRTEQATEATHDLEMTRQRQEAEMRQKEAQFNLAREQRRLQDAQQREHLAVLREMGVDLTAYLTQGRADRIIELRGSAKGAHLHLEQDGKGPKKEG
jgi:Type II secretion system (T2SS), protein E, N-terminal domain